MIAQPRSFTVNLPNPFTPEAIAGRKNTHYSDEYAQSLGYKKATVGGFVWGYILMAAAEAWGTDWFVRGENYNRQRRPIYAGDDVKVRFAKPESVAGAIRCEFEVLTPDGEASVFGWVGLSNNAVEPDVSDRRFIPSLAHPVRVMEGDEVRGRDLSSELLNDPLAKPGDFPVQEYHPRISIADGRLWTVPPDYLRDHPQLPGDALIPWAMSGGSVRADLDYEGSNIQVLWEGEQRFYGVPTLRDRLTMHNRISDTFLRKGSRYFEIESIVVANDTKPIVVEKLRRLIHLGSPRKTA